MTCTPDPPTFRLLDAYVGWDAFDVCRLTGVEDPAGLRLAPVDRRPGLRRRDLLPWFPPDRLASGCGPCGGYLASPRHGLLRRDPCGGGWVPVWPPACRPDGRPRAVTARGHRFAVAAAGRLELWQGDGSHRGGRVPVARPDAMAYAPWGDLLVVLRGSTELYAIDPSGTVRRAEATGLPPGLRISGITTGGGCAIWLLSRDVAEGWRLWRGTRDRAGFIPATLDELAGSARPGPLRDAGIAGFCLHEPGPDGDPVRTCFTWDGDPLDPARLPPSDRRETAGQLLTTAVDSGIARCRWHRVRVDADVPPGTGVEIAVATADEPTPSGAAAGPAAWRGCPAGLPHPDDWQVAPPSALDLLVDQPPGRYLHVRVRLTGDGSATPVVRRVRLDFPRVTSAELLPAVYRQDPTADDFTERFLSLFDASLADLDRVVERHPALLDPHGVPDDVLPWLAGLLGLTFEPEWDAATRRALIVAAPELYRRRGTPWAVREAVRLVFGVDAVVVEHARERVWGSLSGSAAPVRLRSTRLFGRSAARFRVGTSTLSRTPLRSAGDPDDDPLIAAAHRITVLVGRSPDNAVPDLDAVGRLVARQAPAHTVADVRGAGPSFVVGTWSRVGIDTALTPLPAPVLGGSAGAGAPVRLGRQSVLHPAHGHRSGVRLGVAAAVGVHTVAR